MARSSVGNGLSDAIRAFVGQTKSRTASQVCAPLKNRPGRNSGAFFFYLRKFCFGYRVTDGKFQIQTGDATMVDLTKFPSHVQAAIKALDLPAQALKRAEAGRDWLDKNAPYG